MKKMTNIIKKWRKVMSGKYPKSGRAKFEKNIEGMWKDRV